MTDIDKTWEPKVGELCAGVDRYGTERTGPFLKFTEGSASEFALLFTGFYVIRSSLRPAAAHPEHVRVGDRVRGKWLRTGETLTGVVTELDSMSPLLGKRGTVITPDAGHCTSVTLDPATVEKLDTRVLKYGCSCCGASVSQPSSLCSRCDQETKPVEPARVDPERQARGYVSNQNDNCYMDTTERLMHKRDPESERLANRIAESKRQQALDHLGNNSHALRVSRHSAAMDVRAKAKNRGKYGEDLRAHTWDSDDVESV
jgi:hypothetical protein